MFQFQATHCFPDFGIPIHRKVPFIVFRRVFALIPAVMANLLVNIAQDREKGLLTKLMSKQLEK